MTDVFLSVLKTVKVVPVFKNDLKLGYRTIIQSPCYQILKKYLKNLFIRDCILYTFLNNKNIYELQFGFRQQYSTSHALI